MIKYCEYCGCAAPNNKTKCESCGAPFTKSIRNVDEFFNPKITLVEFPRKKNVKGLKPGRI